MGTVSDGEQPVGGWLVGTNRTVGGPWVKV